MLGERLERGERLSIGRSDILGPSAILEMRMFRADRGIIEAGRYGPGVCHLPIRVLQDIGFGAVKDAAPGIRR